MNFIEMVLALFAIVFFTTVSLVYNRSMWTQAENLDNVAKIVQATQLAHSKLDQIDAELLSQQVAFAKRQVSGTPQTVEQHYVGTHLENLTYAGYAFTYTYDFDYCDSLGGTTGVSQTYADTTDYKFIKMNVTVASTPGMSHPVHLFRVYTKTNFYFDY
jgi:hypothetical protein